MKIAKKVLAIAIAVGMIFCLTAMAFAAPSTALSADLKDGVVTLTVACKDAAGLKTFETPVTYDAAVLKIKGAVKDGAYKAQYEGCGESIISAYNTTEAGTIVPGIAIGNEIFDDATLATMMEDNDVEGTPVSTANLVLFTVKFTVEDANATKTTIKCGDAAVTVTLKAEPVTEAPKPTEPAPTEPKPTEPKPTEKPTEAPTEVKPTEAPATEATTAATGTDAPTTAPSGNGNAAPGTVPTGDNAALAVAGAVCALAAAAFVVTKKH